MIGVIWVILLTAACSGDPTSSRRAYRYDPDGMLVIRGKRTFIIGTYSLPDTTDPFGVLAQEGYNYVRVAPERKMLDGAQAHGLMTWITTGSLRADHVAEDSMRIRELVTRFKDHPALLCWEMEDEPAFTWHSAKPRIPSDPLIRTARLIKRTDPDHLIYTNHAPVNLVSTLRAYNPSTDIVACDIYPVIPHGILPTYALFPDGLQGDLLNPYISQVGEYTEKMKKVAGHKKPVFMVLQAFAWEMLKKPEERDPAMILYPTRDQARFMAFDAIVHGATGLIWWGSHYTPADASFRKDLESVTRELASLQEILSARNTDLPFITTYHEMGHSVDAGIERIVKKVNGTIYLITVNSDKNPVKVSLSGLNPFRSATVMGEDRTVPVEKGILTDSYKPFDIHMYKMK